MIRVISAVLVFVVTTSLAAAAQEAAPRGKTFVIVHGAWGGGWAFREVEALLEVKGHKVYRPTLTGQGERVHLAGPDIGLETHLLDVVNMVRFEEVDYFVLVGHSYGGMVVTGVADRIPERIRHLIYLDAFVPKDGESVADINGGLAGMERDENGGIVPRWVAADQMPPKNVPHPGKTLTDPLPLKNNPARLEIPTDYVLFVDPGKAPEEDSFYDSSERAKELGWPVHHMDADHNPQWSAPEALAEMLIKASGE